MKNIELLEKAKKEGTKNLSLYELKRLAQIAWKEDVFSLNGLVNYVQRSNDVYINAMVEKVGISKEVITVKWLLKNAKPNSLKKQTKGTDGKLIYTSEKREKFSLWFISGTILHFHSIVQAKVQSSKPKVQIKEKTELEKANEEEKTTAAKVEQNKRSNAAKKAAATRKKNAAKKELEEAA